MHIVLRNIRKRFGPTVAVDGVDLTFEPGQIHALLGENGAGKTTLMNILYGLYQPDSGTIEADGVVWHLRSPGDAIRLGIGMIHQHFTLVPAMTVTENLILGESRPDRWRLDRKGAAEEIRVFSEQHGLPVDPEVPVWQLPVGRQQRVEILKALRRGARMLILDEPTAVLTPQEADELFAVLRGFREAGKGVVFISHKLHEVMALSDRVTVLRHGRVVGTTETASTHPGELTRLMIGQDMEGELRRRPSPPGAPVLTVERLCVRDDRNQEAVRDVSFQVYAGEILGIAGVDGNGQRELAEALTGLRRVASGRILVQNRDITRSSIGEIARNSVSHIPQDRQTTGLILGFSVEENLMLGVEQLRRHSRRGFLDVRRMRAEAQRLIEAYDIRTQNSRQPVSALSGGNQQKVVFARELSREPAVMVAFNPTRGVDVRATDEIHRRLMDRCAAGSGILLISTELDEVLRLSDRIAVMYNGRIADIVPSGTAREVIGGMMAGVA
jgi:simple sugar transport system ATP-binding protein